MKSKPLTAALLGSFVACTISATAGRPLAVDDAEPSLPGEVWLESGIEPELTRDAAAVELPVCLTLGAMKDFEISVFCCVEHTNGRDEVERGFGVNEIALESKWKILDQERAGVSGALATSVAVPIGSRPEPGFDAGVTGILTHDFGATSVDLHLGFAFTDLQTREPMGRVLSLGAAARHDASESLAVVGDVLVQEQAGAIEARADAGVQYIVSERLVLDAAVGAGSGEETALLVIVGLTCSL